MIHLSIKVAPALDMMTTLPVGTSPNTMPHQGIKMTCPLIITGPCDTTPTYPLIRCSIHLDTKSTSLLRQVGNAPVKTIPHIIPPFLTVMTALTQSDKDYSFPRLIFDVTTN